MRKLITTCAIFAGLSTLGLAETWTGTLLDANCGRRHASATCDVKLSTTAFVLEDNGTRHVLDHKSNYDAHMLLLNRDRNAPKVNGETPVTATITGQMK